MFSRTIKKLENGLWYAYAICSDAEPQHFFGKTNEEVFEMTQNYFKEAKFKAIEERHGIK